MRIKRKPFVIAFLILLCLAMFFSKEALLKSYLSHYLRTRLGATCSIGQLNLSRNSIAASGIHLKHKYFRVDIGKLKIDLAFSGFIKPRLEHIAVSDAAINIESFSQTQAALKKLTAKSGLTSASPAKYPLTLDAISLALKENDLYLNTAFSFAGVVSTKAPLLELKQLKVDTFKLSTSTVSCAFRVEPAGDDRYTLYIDSIKRQDQEIKNISLPLEVTKDNIVLTESPFAFLGPVTSIQGRLEAFSFEHFCFKALLRTATFTNVVQFFGQADNIIFDGPFNGELRLCWEKGAFSDVSAMFSSVNEGTINIRKEVSFDFLKKYLDEESRKALVDSFNNYSYNNGTLTVAKQGDTISVNFNFNSQERGQRDVLVNFHIVTDQ